MILVGCASDEELAAYYRNASLLLLPSRYEGFGFPVLEAMMFGVPVACSMAASLPEVAGRCAAFFDPNSVDDMCRALLSVLDGNVPVARKEVERNLARFDWNRSTYEHLQVLRSLSGKDMGKQK